MRKNKELDCFLEAIEQYDEEEKSHFGFVLKNITDFIQSRAAKLLNSRLDYGSDIDLEKREGDVPNLIKALSVKTVDGEDLSHVDREILSSLVVLYELVFELSPFRMDPKDYDLLKHTLLNIMTKKLKSVGVEDVPEPKLNKRGPAPSPEQAAERRISDM